VVFLIQVYREYLPPCGGKLKEKKEFKMKKTFNVLSVRLFGLAVLIAAIALNVMLITGCSEDEDDPYGRVPDAPRDVIYTQTGYFNYQNYNDGTFIISWTGVPGALQYYVYVFNTNEYLNVNPIPVDKIFDGDITNKNSSIRLIGVVKAAHYGDNSYSYTATLPYIYYPRGFAVSAVNGSYNVNREKISSATKASFITGIDQPVTVTFNANGGYNAPNPISTYSGYKIGLPYANDNDIYRTGYTFTGWRKSYPDNGTVYTAGQEYTVEEDVTFYAQWTQNTP